MNKSASALIGGGLLLGFIYLVYKILSGVWGVLLGLDKQFFLGLVTAFTTIFVATLTVMLGRYFERKKEIESHFRAQKVEIYDNMLKQIFKIFSGDPSTSGVLTRA